MTKQVEKNGCGKSKRGQGTGREYDKQRAWGAQRGKKMMTFFFTLTSILLR